MMIQWYVRPTLLCRPYLEDMKNLGPTTWNNLCGFRSLLRASKYMTILLHLIKMIVFKRVHPLR